MKECTQCGKCCINYSNGRLSASPSEIEYWQNFKPHIYQYVKNDTIWMHPKTGEQLTRCPWLKQQSDGKYTCDIYFDRPEDCRGMKTGSFCEKITKKSQKPSKAENLTSKNGPNSRILQPIDWSGARNCEFFWPSPARP